VLISRSQAHNSKSNRNTTNCSGELDSKLAELEARPAKLKEERAASAQMGDGSTLLSSQMLSFSEINEITPWSKFAIPDPSCSLLLKFNTCQTIMTLHIPHESSHSLHAKKIHAIDTLPKYLIFCCTAVLHAFIFSMKLPTAQ